MRLLGVAFVDFCERGSPGGELQGLRDIEPDHDRRRAGAGRFRLPVLALSAPDVRRSLR